MNALHQRPRRLVPLSLLGIAVTVSSACTATRPTPVSLRAGVETARHGVIEVRNVHHHEVAVAILRSDGRVPHRLGSVRATSDRAFRLPQTMNGVPARVIVECRVTREVFRSRELAWEPRQVVALSVGATLNLSRAVLR